MNWDSKGRKSFGRAQGRRVLKGGKLRASNSELVSSLEKKGLRLALEEYKL